MVYLFKIYKQLNMDKRLFSFLFLKEEHTIEEIYEIFDNENYEINKLDISRLYRFINYLIGDTI